MQELLRKLALTLLKQQLESLKVGAHAFADAEIDAYLDKAATAVEGKGGALTALAAKELRSPDVRTLVHQAVDAEVDKLLDDLAHRLA